jgi:hypothetical protein
MKASDVTGKEVWKKFAFQRKVKPAGCYFRFYPEDSMCRTRAQVDSSETIRATWLRYLHGLLAFRSWVWIFCLPFPAAE